jgi:hypothetical protein
MDISRRLLGSRGQLLRQLGLLVLGGAATFVVTCQSAGAVMEPPTPTPVKQRYAAIAKPYTLESVRSAVRESASTGGRRAAEAQRVERPRSAVYESQAPR